MIFEDQIQTVTYFKDITFGILYEQVKYQSQLERMLTETFQRKVTVPLNTIRQNFEVIENSKELEKVPKLKQQFEGAKMQSLLL